MAQDVVRTTTMLAGIVLDQALSGHVRGRLIRALAWSAGRRGAVGNGMALVNSHLQVSYAVGRTGKNIRPGDRSTLMPAVASVIN
ncbi:hypothetical protein [Nocardia jinanensis]|uniref:hypothetical protein n=1 Tax=Nocardia jinanensis TaxID=382504 RepID=UPI00073871CB|nr:hypothetical protein [Nocardia jinanensis]